MENQLGQLAWVVLRAANRTQAQGSTVRLVVPRAPEVAQDLGMDLTDAQFLSVEEYLLEHDYVATVEMGLVWSTYTVTPAGLRWLETGLAEALPTDRGQELAEGPSEEEAFESALRAELEEERRRIADLERNLNEEPPGAPETAAEQQLEGGVVPRSSGGSQEGAEHVSWWRRAFRR